MDNLRIRRGNARFPFRTMLLHLAALLIMLTGPRTFVQAVVCEGTDVDSCSGLLGSCTSGAMCSLIDERCQAVPDERCEGGVTILQNGTTSPTTVNAT
eukprot:3322625-Pyramimonas_sp.AAC.1